ncbi:hypothetical protein AB4371_22080 [Vibrio sp. 10N.261.51.A3]|uniref:hypothetical protein n=1 Tax=Vibrio sp. 10N.261.51.A3 TaxID=3229673 RepID=UPI003553B6A0
MKQVFKFSILFLYSAWLDAASFGQVHYKLDPSSGATYFTKVASSIHNPSCSQNSILGGYTRISVIDITNAAHGYVVKYGNGVTEQVLTDNYGNQLPVEISVIGHYVLRGPRFWGGGSAKGNYCYARQGYSDHESEMLYYNVGTGVTHDGYAPDNGHGYWEVLLAMRVSPSYSGPLTPGRYYGNVNLNSSTYHLKPRDSWETLSGHIVLDIGHVFKVNIPYRAGSLNFEQGDHPYWGAGLPIKIQTNESFNIKYSCGGNLGKNSNGQCLLDANGFAQRVRIRFDHINSLIELGADVWTHYDAATFNPSLAHVRQQVGSIEFSVADLHLATPGKTYTGTYNFIVEADY